MGKVFVCLCQDPGYLLARRTICRISFTQLPIAKKTLNLYDNRIKQYLMYLQKLKK